jgi:hypothetical protein
MESHKIPWFQTTTQITILGGNTPAYPTALPWLSWK